MTYKPDAEIEARKDRELAWLTRQHCERTLAEKRSGETVQESLYEDAKPMNAAGQTELF